jgi:8-amino-7-oxononanoate synthase
LTVSAVRAGYEILASGEGEKVRTYKDDIDLAHVQRIHTQLTRLPSFQRRQTLQQNIYLFYHVLTTHKIWAHPHRKDVMYLPTEPTWQTQPFLSPIVPLVTAQSDKAGILADKLADANYLTNVVHFPIVPKGMDRIRLMVHADNTHEEIEGVINLIVGWITAELREPAKL